LQKYSVLKKNTSKPQKNTNQQPENQNIINHPPLNRHIINDQLLNQNIIHEQPVNQNIFKQQQLKKQINQPTNIKDNLNNLYVYQNYVPQPNDMQLRPKLVKKLNTKGNSLNSLFKNKLNPNQAYDINQQQNM
jgi:hypothetical protein